MAKVVSPLEGGERKNHKYIKREWKNGKWQYWYKDPAKNATDVSQLKNQNGVNATSSTERKTGDWAKAWLENKNKKSSAVGSAASVAVKVKSGKAAASKLVKTEPVYKAKTTTSPALSNEEYKKKAEEFNAEAKTKMEQNEQQYREAYEKEKENYRTKLMNSLISKYGDAVPEEEKARIDAKVEEYTKTLWKDVYEPQVKRINSAIEEANNSIQRALKRKYSDVELIHSELYHYGIPGQKWGERNGPPYPLGQNQKSSSEKNGEKNKKKIHISKEQLKTLAKVGAAVAVTGLAVWGRYTMYNNGTLYKLAGIGKKRMRFDLDIQIFGESEEDDNYTISEFLDMIDQFEDCTNEEIFYILGKYDRVKNYNAVIEQVKSNATKIEKKRELFLKNIGDHQYLIINHFNHDYDIIWAQKIPNTNTGLAERRRLNGWVRKRNRKRNN